MTEFIQHALIKPKTIQTRLYQELLVGSVLEKGNTLVVAPTALGKTIVAVMVAAHLLAKNSNKKILILAPTRPLCEQHAQSFKKFLQIPEEEITVLTGTTQQKYRAEEWDNAKIICATPQTIENDVIVQRVQLREVQACIFDETHRAVKEYSYVFLGKQLNEIIPRPLILALTASPGSSQEKIREICENLGIENIEIKTLHDADVQEYVKPIDVEFKYVQLEPEVKEIAVHLRAFVKEKLHELKNLQLVRTEEVEHFNRKRLIALQLHLRQLIGRHGKQQPYLYAAVSKVAAVMKVLHALELVETQGLSATQEYFERMQEKSLSKDGSKADKTIMNNEQILNAKKALDKAHEGKSVNPKMEELKKIIQEQFKENPRSRVLVFNHYRDNLNHVVKELETMKGINACAFIGQASKGKTKGLSQKQQVKILEEFKAGDINVLVSTSVGEEGLDVPSCDLVVFFEPVSSEVRWIQRRGRTGRSEAGKTIVLVAKGTRDEAYMWSALKKEKKMIKELQHMSKQQEKGKPLELSRPELKRSQQTTLEKFKEGNEETVLIYVDTREQGTEVLRKISEFGCRVQVKQLEVGDFVLSNDICVERKTVSDFLQSMVDGRLFQQMMNLVTNYNSPLVIVEGSLEELFTLRDIHKNAILGALSSIALRYHVPILFARNAEETAEYLMVIAKREQLGKEKDIKLRTGRPGLSMGQQQQFIIESLPLIGPKTAKELLKKFKSVKGIVNASEKELQETENIGEIKAKKIREVLDSKYKEE